MKSHAQWMMDERRVMDANYLDFNKAFDMFCPNIPVVGKIQSGHMVKSGSHTKIKGCCSVNDLKSHCQLVTSGVP